jgi:hypothetical protein
MDPLANNNPRSIFGVPQLRIYSWTKPHVIHYRGRERGRFNQAPD